MRIRPRWVVLGASAVAVTASLADNNWDVNAIGIVRFGRAAFTVSIKGCFLHACLIFVVANRFLFAGRSDNS